MSVEQLEQKEEIIRLLEQKAAVELHAAEKTGFLHHLKRVIDAEIDVLTIQEQKAIAGCEARVKELTVEFGQTVSGSVYQATYNSGRTTWDNAGLKGFAVAHPEIEQFQRVSKPYVSIKKRRNNAS